MTCEERFDEVTAVITGKCDVEDLAGDFFPLHDDDPSLCTLDRAHADARAVHPKYRQGAL